VAETIINSSLFQLGRFPESAVSNTIDILSTIMGDPTVKTEPVDEPMVYNMEWQSTVDNVTVPKINKTPQAWGKYIEEQKRPVKPLLLASMKNKRLPNPTTAQSVVLHDLAVFLTWLDTEFEISPSLNKNTKIDAFVKRLFDAEIHFPPEYAEKAQAIYEKWEGQNWGEPPKKEEDSLSDDSDDEGAPPRKTQGRKTSATASSDKRIYVPPANDRVWGTGGILYGVALNWGGSGKPRQVLHPRFKSQKRSAKVHGNNGLQNGDWFPSRISTIFRGAHGGTQAGITGDEAGGAYSIVVSSAYEEFDKDGGETITYCGSGSHENTDPKRVAETSGTKALRHSISAKQDVRVLRSSNGKSAWSPQVGIRYDGLYRVVSASFDKNNHGGMVEKFKLVRKAGQGPILTSRPTKQEVRDYETSQQTSLRNWTLWDGQV
jgi:hypothetical protein